MKSKTENFQSLISSFQPMYDLPNVFSDFLTMTICSLSPDPGTGKSRYEDEYMRTIEKYRDSSARFTFPKAFAALVDEMTAKIQSDQGNDVLGEFFEIHLKERGNNSIFFTPDPICKFMAKSAFEQNEKKQDLRILDPACGSGRLLYASFREAGTGNYYFGIDIDERCVKMATINAMLSGMFRTEIMCGNALLPDDFRFSYCTSLFPLGIFKITDREKSPLWHLMQNTLKEKKKPVIPEPPEWSEGPKSTFGEQLTLL